MNAITAIFCATMLVGCILSGKEDVSFPLTVSGELASLDSTGAGSRFPNYTYTFLKVEIDSGKIIRAMGSAEYRLYGTDECESFVFYGKSKSAINISQPKPISTPRWDVGFPDGRPGYKNVRWILVPPDSAFTHFRLIIDCKPHESE